MDWLERTAKLRQWSRSGTRAPHKPLLFLYALGRFHADADAELRYSAVEEDLKQLLAEYGPPNRTSPAYPFHHLVSDGVWEMRTDRGPAAAPAAGCGSCGLREPQGGWHRNCERRCGRNRRCWAGWRGSCSS